MRWGVLVCVLQLFWMSQPTFAKPPNVILIISDDQAWTDYSFMGHGHIQTPNIDQLAKDSLTFTRGYVPSSLCRPSLATMITGLYPHQHKIVGNDPAVVDRVPGRNNPQYNQRREQLISHIDSVKTLPKWLGEIGFVSHQSGKWWEGNFSRGGFSAGMTRGFPQPGGRHGDDGLTIGRQGLAPVTNFMDQAVAEHKPFFVWYAPFLPHTPHNPPERLLQKYKSKVDSLPIAKYWAMCEWFDETVGQLLDHVDKQGIAEETLVLYVTDNGWINLPDKSAYAPRSKRSPNEGGIRTPVMVRWPKTVQPKMDSQTLVSSIDLVPTILTACGVDVPADLPGINLLDPKALKERDSLYGEILEHDVVDVDDPAKSLKYRWVIQDNWKLIQPDLLADSNQVEMYDLANDPHENSNLANAERGRVAELQASLNAWWAPNKE
ncbi:MAG: sulfatase [Planctomycetales bacterium]|nr:sulfatase [Planctomycetales bacterium]